MSKQGSASTKRGTLIAEKWIERYRFHLIGTVIIAICWLLSFNYIFQNAVREQLVHQEDERLGLEMEINSVINTYEEFGTYIFEQVINTPEILSVVEEAGRSDEEKQNVLRDTLYDLLKSDYDPLLLYHFKQLQFHFSNGDSFLRFNEPDKYGDNLLSLRDSIRIVNTEKKPVFGFEAGRVFNGYRLVFPLIYQGHHVGSAELALSLNGVTELLQDTYPENNIIYILKKEVVEGAVFKEQQGNYVISGMSEVFLIDREVSASIFNEEKGAELYNQKTLVQQMRQGAQTRISEDKPFSYSVTNHGEVYLVQFLPILNVKQKTVGYFVSSSLDDHDRVLQGKKSNELLLVTLVFLLVELLLFIYLHERRNAKIRASMDGLTQICNRLKFTEVAKREMYRSIRYQKDLCIIFFDLDNFKQINDTYGHSVGDVVLKSLATSIKPLLRGSDILARWGGEEFIILLPETSSEGGMILAERIRTMVAETSYELPRSVTISLGVAQRHPEDTQIDNIIERADIAMYQAKNKGKNCCVLEELSK